MSSAKVTPEPGGLHTPAFDAGSIRQKIPCQLDGRPVVPTPEPVGQALPPALKFNSRQGMITGEIRRCHAHQQSGVGIAAVPFVLTHPVCHQAMFLGSGGHHIPAGAHAKGVGGPAVFSVVSQLVIGRPQPRVPGIIPVLSPVDQVLGMLDPNPDGEGLPFHGHTPFMQDREGVPGAVTDGQKNRQASSQPLIWKFSQTPIFDKKIGHLRLKPHCPTKGHTLPDILIAFSAGPSHMGLFVKESPREPLLTTRKTS